MNFQGRMPPRPAVSQKTATRTTVFHRHKKKRLSDKPVGQPLSVYHKTMS